MLEETTIYPDYQKSMNYLNEQKARPVRHYDADDLEGFKLLFPVPEPEDVQEEFFDAGDDFIEAEKCYDNPQTQAQMYELERYGFFYK